MLHRTWSIVTVLRKAVLQCRPSILSAQCMESVIAFYQDVRYDNDNL